MCGIAGLWRFRNFKNRNVLKDVERMIVALRHRGPDDYGVWTEGQIALGQSRLAIIDLSPHGHQPMLSADKRYVLVFNGEIYNYKDLARQLAEDHCFFEVRNDTEVLLKACIHWGVEKTLRRLNGMFAFAFYDTQERTLTIARDRFGEKPLYYAYNEHCFAFGSELKALCTLPDFNREIDEEALNLYLRLNYIPCPYSIYKSAKKLFPGHFLVIKDTKLEDRCYYDLEQEITNRTLLDLSEEELVQSLDEKLQKSVQERMVADVSVGAFLSGGIDSSLMVALMQSQSEKPIKTFTVGFKDSPWDESNYAETIAKHLKTDHTTLYATDDAILEGVDLLTSIYDEPFGDASALSTFLVSKLFRKHVTVAIGGDGGDELFAGYHRHKWVPLLHQVGKLAPKLATKALQKVCTYFPSEKLPVLGNKLQKASRALSGGNFLETYINSVSYGQQTVDLNGTWFKPHPQLKNDAEQVMYCDMRTFLHDDVLCKVDRASMAVSLETRAPFLDYDLVDFAWQIPLSKKFFKKTKKYLLKQVLNRYVPQALWDRPKMGFGMPLAQAFRTSLKTQFETYLNLDTPLWKYWKRSEVEKLWQQHLAAKITHEHLLWNCFVVQQFFSRL